MSFLGLFPSSPALVGMVHVQALPGTPRSRLSPQEIVQHALGEARLLLEEGVDALLIENMHDRPYCLGRVGPEVVATMTAVAVALRALTERPIGLQILAGANLEALAVAQAAQLQFIRAEGFVFGHLADEGLFDEASAAALLRERRRLGAESVRVIVDIQKKHSSHALSADLSLGAWARAAEFFLADGLVMTGSETGSPVSISDLAALRLASSLPIFVGSGVTPESVAELVPQADVLIVGSALKVDGRWDGAIDPRRVRDLVAACAAARSQA